MRRHAACLAVLALAVGGCGVGVQERGRTTTDAEVPYGLLETDAPALIPPRGTEAVDLCLIRDDRLVTTTRVVDEVPSPAELLRSLADDVSDDEATAGLRTAFPDAAIISGVTVRFGTAIVELTSPLAPTGSDPILPIAQIVCTLTSQPGIGLVTFTVGGAPVQVPTPAGSLADGPVSRDDYLPTLGAGEPPPGP